MGRYLFVDYGCLREALKTFSQRYFGDDTSLQFREMSLSYGYDKIFIYDALPAQAQEESRADYEARIEARMATVRRLRSLPGFHAPMGDLRGKKATQKKVDVMITVDMLLHTVRGNMSQCTLLTGDSDFQPLLEALLREGMKTTLWHPKHAPDDLTAAADFCTLLSPWSLQSGLFRPNGQPLLPEWRDDIRPVEKREILAVDTVEGWVYQVSRAGDTFMLERFNAKAAATSKRATDTDLRILLRSGEDFHAMPLGPSILALLQ